MKETMRANTVYILLLIAAMSTSCGTIVSNIELSRAIKQRGQDNIVCGKIPFIYSGVWVDTAVMIECAKNPGHCDRWMAEFLVYDWLLSTAADTAILPYSIYRQYKYCWSSSTDNTIK